MDEIPDDLAFLSDDIIHDVLEFAHFERLTVRLNSLSILPVNPPIGGRWGEIALTFCYFKLMGNIITECRLDGDSTWYPAPAIGRNDVAVNSLYLTHSTDFNENEIKHLAANAYELLEVYCKVFPKEFLENLGNRFTSIIWLSGNEGQTEIDFLKRQLNSPHLRVLECDNPVLARPEFIDFLVDFVRKKNFETLKSSECFSPEVFLAAYETWIQRSEREHLLSSISAPISTEDLRELTARIPNFSWIKRIEGFRTEWSYSEKNPNAEHYEMRMTYKDLQFVPSDVKRLTMTLQ